MDIDKATLTMIENLNKNSGKTLEEWVEIVKKEKFNKHGEIVKFLKENHGFTHGFANLVALKTKESVSETIVGEEELIAAQYKGKEDLKPIYDRLLAQILVFGSDIEIAPKIAYVSLRRNKQFATLTPATKTRFEIGVNLKGQEPEGKLEAEKANAMCSHKIKINEIKDVDAEVIKWIKAAYDKAV